MNTPFVRPPAATLLRLVAFLAALCLLGLAAACSQGPERGQGPQGPTSEAAESTDGKLVLYACPMNDIPPLPAPGKCPVCGMQLTPIAMGDAEPGTEARSRLAPAQMRLAGLRTESVKRRYVTATVELYGQVDYDDAFITEIVAPTNGIMDRVFIRRVGEYVRAEQKLFDFYSSEIHDLETQLLESAQLIPDYVSSQLGVPVNPALRDPSAQPPDEQRTRDAKRRYAMVNARLRGLGLLNRDIHQILRMEQPPGVFTVRMPRLTTGVGGVILANKAVQGAYVNKGTLLVRIADPNFIWINFDAFERDFPWLRNGQEIEFTSPARPGEVFKAKVNNIDPVFDEKNRTFRVGVGYNDSLGLLRPNMSVRGRVKTLLDKEGRPAKEGTAPERAPLVIPVTAPLVTGERAVVYVAVPDKPGVFEGREIVLGPKADEAYVVLAGLAEGEQVVTDGAFKIDSERQIQAKPSMLKPEGLVRQQEYNASVPPLPNEQRSALFNQRPQGSLPTPGFPPAEVFASDPNAGPGPDPGRPGPANGATAAPQPGPAGGSPPPSPPGKQPYRNPQSSTGPAGQ